MQYFVVEHTYETKSSFIVGAFGSIHNATAELEELVQNFVMQFMGKESQKIHNHHNYASRYWNNVKGGYHIMKDKFSLYKFIIVHKKLSKGYVYDSSIISPVYHFDIVKVQGEDETDSEDFEGYHRSIPDEVNDIFEDVLKEIESLQAKIDSMRENKEPGNILTKKPKNKVNTEKENLQK